MKLATQDFERAAQRLHCPLAAVRAVCEVEAPRGGFNPDGSVVTLFEGHWFYKLTKGAYAQSHPNLCFPNWTREHYGKTWQQEQDRLKTAQALSYDAACKSASWGRFQIMGFNHAIVGFPNVREFVNAMKESEGRQLDAFVEFIEHRELADELQRGDWKSFARIYNGPRFYENRYDEKLSAAYRKWATT